jgi:hypothetical protein
VDVGHGENSNNKMPLALIPGYLSRGTKEHGQKTQGALKNITQNRSKSYKNKITMMKRMVETKKRRAWR